MFLYNKEIFPPFNGGGVLAHKSEGSPVAGIGIESRLWMVDPGCGEF